jgi:4-hydroxy-2-oxoheptanedioate aldolase
MKQNRLLQKLWQEETVFGLFCSLPQSHLVEMIGYVGFDFVIIDAEHTLVNQETLEQMVRAAEVSDLTALVRVPHASSPLILQVLDAGADGIVVPHVCSAREVQEAVRRARYAPDGMRSLNAGRPARFGIDDLASFVREANKQVMVVPMIEDREGVERIDEIVSVPGITMVLEGAADLSQSYGVAWQTSHRLVQRALRRIQCGVSQHRIPFCAIPRSPEEIAHWSRQGVRAFVLGEQRGIVLRGLRDHLQMFRGCVKDVQKHI